MLQSNIYYSTAQFLLQRRNWPLLPASAIVWGVRLLIFSTPFLLSIFDERLILLILLIPFVHMMFMPLVFGMLRMISDSLQDEPLYLSQIVLFYRKTKLSSALKNALFLELCLIEAVSAYVLSLTIPFMWSSGAVSQSYFGEIFLIVIMTILIMAAIVFGGSKCFFGILIWVEQDNASLAKALNKVSIFTRGKKWQIVKLCCAAMIVLTFLTAAIQAFGEGLGSMSGGAIIMLVLAFLLGVVYQLYVMTVFTVYWRKLTGGKVNV